MFRSSFYDAMGSKDVVFFTENDLLYMNQYESCESHDDTPYLHYDMSNFDVRIETSLENQWLQTAL